jgi:lipopolysaccharide/colanic/teichoic acid biosynthesis glycosyltransferase
LASRAVEPNDRSASERADEVRNDRVVDLDTGEILDVTTIDDLSVVRRLEPASHQDVVASPRRVYAFVPRRARPPWVKPDVLVLGDDLPNYLRAERSFLPLTESGLRDLLEAPARPTGRRAKPPLVAIPGREPNGLAHIVERLESQGIPVVPLRDIVQARCRLAFLDEGALALPRQPWWRRAAIRAVDLIVGLIGCAVLFLALPFVAAAIWLEDRGPVLYSQERIGRGGKHFSLHKFRSMRPDAESSGPAWARLRDDRITRVGGFLRRYKIDELPQFLNVLAGHMSIVGPRPERAAFADTLRELIPGYDARHRVKPGLTGWGTLRVGYGNSIEAKYLTHQYDMYHLKNRTLRLDLEIMARSVYAIITGPERRDPFML